MSLSHNFSVCNTSYGALKILHVIFGGSSLLLVSGSYIHFWALDLFLITIAICFTISTINLAITCFFPSRGGRSLQIVGSVFHIAAGTCLIVAGIDLIGWSDYDEHCGFKCPRVYYIGLAKILTFINGTLYGIHGFLQARGESLEGHGYERLSHSQLSPPHTNTNDTTMLTLHENDNGSKNNLYQSELFQTSIRSYHQHQDVQEAVEEPQPHYSGSCFSPQKVTNTNTMLTIN